MPQIRFIFVFFLIYIYIYIQLQQDATRGIIFVLADVQLSSHRELSMHNILLESSATVGF